MINQDGTNKRLHPSPRNEFSGFGQRTPIGVARLALRKGAEEFAGNEDLRGG
jgi:hypothetical protein